MERDTGKDAKERLFDAAVEVFAEKGHDAATVRDIVARAGGANPSAVNYHFGSKEKLYEAVCAVMYGELGRRMEEPNEEEGRETPPVERLRRFIVDYCRLVYGGGLVSDRFRRIFSREMLDPRGDLGQAAREHLIPQARTVRAILRDIAGPDVSEARLSACQASIMAQLAYFGFVEPLIAHVEPDHPGLEAIWPLWAEHVLAFSLAGLRGIQGLAPAGAANPDRLTRPSGGTGPSGMADTSGGVDATGDSHAGREARERDAAGAAASARATDRPCARDAADRDRGDKDRGDRS